MAKKETETQITKTDAPGAMVVHDYGEDYGSGFGNLTKADLAIPFLNLLQALSPIVAAEQAKPGQWFNTVTEHAYDRDRGFAFVAAITKRFFVEWTPRDSQGQGFVAQHLPESDIVQKAVAEAKGGLKFKTPEGNLLVDTRYVYGALCTDDDKVESMAVIPFFSTKIKPYRLWMQRMAQMLVPVGDKQKSPPMYAHLTRITSFMDQSKSDPTRKFYVPVIRPDKATQVASLLAPDDVRFQMAKECKRMIEADAVKIDYSKSENAAKTAEEVPF